MSLMQGHYIVHWIGSGKHRKQSGTDKRTCHYTTQNNSRLNKFLSKSQERKKIPADYCH